MTPNCPEVKGGASVTMQQTNNNLLHMYPVFGPFFRPWSMVILHYFEEHVHYFMPLSKQLKTSITTQLRLFLYFNLTNNSICFITNDGNVDHKVIVMITKNPTPTWHNVPLVRLQHPACSQNLALN